MPWQKSVMTSKPLHKGHHLWMAAVPCQPRARHNDSRDKRFDIPTPGLLPLRPLSHGCVDKTNDPRLSESTQMHQAKNQLEAQRAKFAAKDTNDSVWLLWKQLLWVERNGCRHHRAWQWWQITQHASSVCAWYEEHNFCIFCSYFPVIIEPNSDESWYLYYFVTEGNFVFKSWLKSHGEQSVKAAYRVGAAIFCGLKNLYIEILLDNHYMLYRDSSWPEEFADQINANRAK